MESEGFGIGSKFLVGLGLTSLAVPVWGASPSPSLRPVTSVTAAPPLASSGGSTPNITLSGEVPIANGGTGTTTGLAGVQKKVGKVAIVAKSGGDYTSPVTAMENAAAWCGTPSATNPCLMKIMPGVYDLAGDALTMKPYMDIEGSGEKTTVITSQHETMVSGVDGVINGADNAEIRFLTVSNVCPQRSTMDAGNCIGMGNFSQSPKITYVTVTASGEQTFGIYNGSSSPTMSNVTVTSEGRREVMGIYNIAASPTMSSVTVKAVTGSPSYGINNDIFSSPIMTNVTVWGGTVGVINSGSSPIMTNVTVTASASSGSAVSNNTSSPTMINVTASAPAGYGMTSSSNTAVTIIADRSTFEGAPTMGAIFNESNVTLKIGASKIVGGVTNSGTLICAGSYNGDYVAVGTDCQ